MAFQYVALFALLAVANAGLIGAPVAYSAGYAAPYAATPYAANYGAHAPAITSQSSNIHRSYGNLGQVSTYSKTIDTPYSSVSKSDVRVSNPGYSTYAAPAYQAAYAAPAYQTAYAAPAVHAAYAAPAVHAAYAAPAVHSAYAAPAVHSAYAAPAVHAAYAAPAVHAAYAAPAIHAAPAIATAGHGLLGVAYSAAPVVSHVSYSNALGLNYGW